MSLTAISEFRFRKMLAKGKTADVRIPETVCYISPEPEVLSPGGSDGRNPHAVSDEHDHILGGVPVGLGPKGDLQLLLCLVIPEHSV